MGTLILLRGNSGSGKTTVAKALQDRFGPNTLLLSQDVIRRDMLKVKDGPDSPAIALLKALLIYGCHRCQVVILEGILDADCYKTLFELAVRLYGDEIHAYYFDLPFEETLRRHQTKPNRHEFGEKEMRRWWKEKDFSDVLNEIPIPPERDLDSIVGEICGAVEKGKETGR